MFRSLIVLSLAALALASCGNSPEKPLSGRLEATDAWIASVPPSAKATGAYFTLTNGTPQTQTLEGVECPLARRVELHNMRMEDEMMYMERLERLEVASGETLTLESGGLHVMLMGLTRVPAAGETVPLTLHFAGDQSLTLEAAVKKPGAR